MITFMVGGDIFSSGCQALVNPVNCVGVMGAGLAAEFKRRYPDNFDAYALICKEGLTPGEVFVFDTAGKSPRFIINFPTKKHWKDPARLEYITAGLENLTATIEIYEIHSIAIPALGCGLGGLVWHQVKPLIIAAMEPLTGVEVMIYPPK